MQRKSRISKVRQCSEQVRISLCMKCGFKELCSRYKVQSHQSYLSNYFEPYSKERAVDIQLPFYILMYDSRTKKKVLKEKELFVEAKTVIVRSYGKVLEACLGYGSESWSWYFSFEDL